jgi:membrane protease YdiL (CAAX protease family)
VIAWVATLLLSNLPLVIARDLLGGDIPWIAPAWIGLAIALVAATYIWQGLKPLRGYFGIMALILLLTLIGTPLITGTSFWDSLFGGRPEMFSLFAYRVLLSVLALVALGILILFGRSRQEVFLTAGDLRAPARGIRIPGRKEPASWLAFGATMAILLGALFFLFMASQNPDALSDFSVVLPWLPLILISAALNAFGEEGLYRAAPLAPLLPAVGGRHALWMTSVWFGLGHYYGGIPSGAIGAVLTGLLGLLPGCA